MPPGNSAGQNDFHEISRHTKVTTAGTQRGSKSAADLRAASETREEKVPAQAQWDSSRHNSPPPPKEEENRGSGRGQDCLSVGKVPA